MKTLLILVLALFLISGVSCKKEKTTWTSDWIVPLVNDTLDLSKWVNDSTIVASGSLYQLSLQRTVFNQDISQFLVIPDTTIIQNLTLPVASINVAPGTSFLNQTEEHTINAEGAQLKKIRVKSGKLKIALYNPLATKTELNLKLPGVSKNGVNFNETYQLPAKVNGVPGLLQREIDLSNYEFNLTGIDGNGFNTMLSQVTVKSDPAGPSVTMTAADVTKVEATMSEVKLDYARGYFGSRVVQDTVDVALDFLRNITAGAIDLPATQIKLTMENGMKFDAQGKFQSLFNTNGQNASTVSLTGGAMNQLFSINSAQGNEYNLTPSVHSFLFTSMNSNINDYLENLGSKHELAYWLKINPFGNVSGSWNEVFPNSRLKVKLEVNMPLACGLNGLEFRDTFTVNLLQNRDKSFIEQGRLVLNLANAFPIAGDLVIEMLDEAGTSIHSLNSPEKIASSNYGVLQNGIKVNESLVTYVLTPQQILDLDKVKSLVIRAKFDTPVGSSMTNQQVQIPVGAFLSVKARGEFKLKNQF